MQGQVLKNMLLGLISSTALAGSFDTSQFNFQHYNLMSNRKMYPMNSYDLSFSTYNSLQVYNDLLDTLTRLNESTGELAFNRTMCDAGYTFSASTAH